MVLRPARDSRRPALCTPDKTPKIDPKKQKLWSELVKKPYTIRPEAVKWYCLSKVFWSIEIAAIPFLSKIAGVQSLELRVCVSEH